MPKISGLPTTTTPTGADILPIVQSGTTKQTTFAKLPISDAVTTALALKADANNTNLTGTTTINGTLTGAGVTKAAVGLGNVDNTSDVNKPVSTAQQAAMYALSYLKNKIRNGNFIINQRAKSGTVTLAAGVYGQDGWKAGASGCTYTFTTTGNRVVITITSGSLVQAIEDVLLESGQYTLSNQGSAQARVAINGAALTGAFAACPITTGAVTGGLTGNASVLVEFSTGTLDQIQFELGTTMTSFEKRLYPMELLLNQRYFEIVRTHIIGTATGVMYFGCLVVYKVTKRGIPTVTWGVDTISNNANTKTISDITTASLFTSVLSVGSGSCEYGAEMNVSAEL